MKRRQFLKSVVATTGATMMPTGLLASGHLPAGAYERALKFLSGEAYFSPGYLLSKLGIDDSDGRILINRLKDDGLVTTMGRMDMMASKSFYKEQAELVRQAIHINSATISSQKPPADLSETADKVRDLHSEPAEQIEPASAQTSPDGTALQPEPDRDKQGIPEDDQDQFDAAVSDDR